MCSIRAALSSTANEHFHYKAGVPIADDLLPTLATDWPGPLNDDDKRSFLETVTGGTADAAEKLSLLLLVLLGNNMPLPPAATVVAFALGANLAVERRDLRPENDDDDDDDDDDTAAAARFMADLETMCGCVTVVSASAAPPSAPMFSPPS